MTPVCGRAQEGRAQEGRARDGQARDGQARDGQAGFTLIEMLVALALFALVGLASFAVLDTVIRTRERTEGRLEAVAQIDRALILFGRDVAQGRAADLRLEEGRLMLTGPERGALDWTGEAGVLRRRALGPDGGVRVTQALVSPVDGVVLRVLDSGGQWHEAWPPEDDAASPRGVELRFDIAPDGPLGRETLNVRRLAETVRPVEP
jgi:general secretion pathway protein J